jgi:hypothetical protein
MCVRLVWKSKGDEERSYYEIWYCFFTPSAMKSIDFWKNQNIRRIHAPKRKPAQIQRSAKGALEREVPGICRECGEVCVGQTGRSSATRCKEHRKSTLAEHSISTGHCSDFSETSLLHRTSELVDRLVKEAHLNRNDVNRDCDFILSQAWSLMFTVLMNVKSGPSTASTWLHTQTLFVSSPALTSSYIMTRRDSGGGQFPDDEDTDGFEMSVCSSFTHLPFNLLGREYFNEWGFGFLTHIAVSDVPGFDQVFTARYELGL